MNINGYDTCHQTNQKHFFNIYSPDTHSNVCIKPGPTSSKLENSETALSNLQALIPINSDQQLDSLKHYLKCCISNQAQSIVILKKLKQKFSSYLTNFDNFNQIYSQSLPFNKTQQPDAYFAHLEIYPVSGIIYLYEQSTDEQSAVQEIMAQYENRTQSPQILICGGKDAGKSTYLRYMINCLLNKYDKCAYIDCDPGQPEFTLSTCLQLTYVTQPLFGPPHTHLNHRPNECVFIGVLSPSDLPDHYLSCLNSLYTTYSRDEKKCPLIINTMGWNQGLGLCLLKEQIKLFKPDFVIQINTTDANKNLPLITNDWYETSTYSWPPLSKHDRLNYQLIVLERNLKRDGDLTRKRRAYSAKDHRTIGTISYFADLHDGLSGFKSIHHLRPYRIPWSKFALHVLHAQIDFNEIFRVFNASLIALCKVDLKFLKKTGSNESPLCIDMSLNERPSFNCVGFGIVRAINTDTKELYILTPESESKLDDVNCLVKGMLNVPLEFFYQQDYDSNTSPYVTFVDNVNVVAAEPMQRKFLVHTVSSLPASVKK